MIKLQSNRKKVLKCCDVWFPDSIESNQIKGNDLVFYHGVSEDLIKSLGNRNKIVRSQNSLITNLCLSEEDLFGKIDKKYRYEIRRSQKHDVECHSSFSYDSHCDKDFKELCDCYMKLYLSKGIKGHNPYVFGKTCMNSGNLIVTVASIQGQNVVYHAYLSDDRNVRLWKSCSDFRNMEDKQKQAEIAEANKRLHWEDIISLKALGYRVYDWGGVFSFSGENGIDHFKMKFGGDPITYYNVSLATTFIGDLAIRYLNRKGTDE